MQINIFYYDIYKGLCFYIYTKQEVQVLGTSTKLELGPHVICSKLFVFVYLTIP